MAHRLLSREEQDWRDSRILQKVDLGCDYTDIARAYGLSPHYISNILRRRRHENKKDYQMGNRIRRGINRYCSLDGCN